MSSIKFGLHCHKGDFYSVLTPLRFPSKMETHLWYTLSDDIKSPSLLKQYEDILSSCEKEKVLRRDGSEFQKNALLARVLVRTTMARYYVNSEINPKSLKFKNNIFGKPEIEWLDTEVDLQRLHFNISHTSSLIACAVRTDAAIGIDVENKKRTIKTEILSFARRFFSPVEVEFLKAISDPHVRRQEFIKLWTLKEAYVKALGKGFSAMPFNTFTIQMNSKSEEGYPSEHKLLSHHENSKLKEANNIGFSLLELAASHYAAVCRDDSGPAHCGLRKGCVKTSVWKTIPFVEDEFVSGTNDVIVISGST